MPFTFGRPKLRPKRVFWCDNGKGGHLKVWLLPKAEKQFPKGDIVKFQWRLPSGRIIEHHMKLWEAGVLAAGLVNALTVWVSDEPKSL